MKGFQIQVSNIMCRIPGLNEHDRAARRTMRERNRSFRRRRDELDKGHDPGENYRLGDDVDYHSRLVRATNRGFQYVDSYNMLRYPSGGLLPRNGGIEKKVKEEENGEEPREGNIDVTNTSADSNIQLDKNITDTSKGNQDNAHNIRETPCNDGGTTTVRLAKVKKCRSGVSILEGVDYMKPMVGTGIWCDGEEYASSVKDIKKDTRILPTEVEETKYYSFPAEGDIEVEKSPEPKREESGWESMPSCHGGMEDEYEEDDYGISESYGDYDESAEEEFTIQQPTKWQRVGRLFRKIRYGHL